MNNQEVSSIELMPLGGKFEFRIRRKSSAEIAKERLIHEVRRDREEAQDGRWVAQPTGYERWQLIGMINQGMFLHDSTSGHARPISWLDSRKRYRWEVRR